MTAKIMTLKAVASRIPVGSVPSIPKPDWLLDVLRSNSLIDDAVGVWSAWPALEQATFKLSRLFGQNIKTFDGRPMVASVVMKAIHAFRTRRLNGATLDASARAYLREIIEVGEMMVTNRVEAQLSDGTGDVHLWDMSLGPFDDWVANMPMNYRITVHKIDAIDGEFEGGRNMIAALILAPSDYARLAFQARNSAWGSL
jgi:hypothetical protein